ncbi:MAG: cell envelope integrity protein TolA [Planctomycetaceae bacterium]|jgi:hypothetical protein|nr:cell envelope integrity protein TolA [Planctomycetaceae bacterium]
MIQEQISTSSPRCLDGNSGFGVVAQTSGMAPNVSREVSKLSGYTHFFSAGDVRNPVVFLHVIRRVGGMDHHIVSRVADCGNDYSGRTNRIAHHLIIEELDLQHLPCGPAAILSQADLFLTQWKDKPRELSLRQSLPNPTIFVQKCFAWEQFCGDAGWGGVVAERIEVGDPVSVIFESGKNILPLIAEVFSLLPDKVRWRTTFSTFFMKSQEPPATNKIQVKCIAANSDEMMFARLSPNTLVVDLRKKIIEPPVGKYVEIARFGTPKPSVATPFVVPVQIAGKIETANDGNLKETNPQITEINNKDCETYNVVIQPITVPSQLPVIIDTKNPNDKFWLNAIPVTIFFVIFFICGLAFVFYELAGQSKTETQKIDSETLIKINAAKNEQERKKIAAEAEANARAKNAAEKVERERKEREEAKVKADAEKAERERKEAEAKNTAEKIETERKQKEAKEREIAKEKELGVKLAMLPEGWEGLGLPFAGGVNVAVLQDSKFLAEIRNRVKISYKPFVDLEPKTEKLFQNIKKTERFDNIEFWYEDGKDVNGKSIKKTIAKIDLKDNGLNFKFDDQLQGHKTDADTIRQFNRILLAKLKIEIDGIPVKKDIALYTPARMNSIDTKRFTFWGQNAKEYVLPQKENSPLYFDIRKFCTIHNSKEQVQLVLPKKIVSLQSPFGYVHEVSYKGEKGTCQIRTIDQKTVMLELNFFSHSLEKLLNKHEELTKQINDKIRLQSEAEKKKKDAEKILANTRTENENKEPARKHTHTKPEIIRFTEQKNGELNLGNKELNVKIKEAEKELKNYNLNIAGLDNEIKKLIDEKQRVENNLNDQKAWNYIQLEEFSLYLLKPETKANEAGNKENQLLLLEVKP